MLKPLQLLHQLLTIKQTQQFYKRTDTKLLIQTSNGDKSANIAANFVDVQTLTLSLLDDLNLDSSADLTGADLTSVVVSGTGDFDLNTNTITAAVQPE